MIDSEKTAVENVLRYHGRTKHHYDRYARSPGHMDWANQPEPFRFYKNVPIVKLPFLDSDPAANHKGLYEAAKDTPRPLGLDSIAGLLELSVGLSAWKASGQARWSLRINPSSGNLHPTETHLVLPPLEQQTAGVYHYNPLLHELENRACLPNDLWQQVQNHFGCSGFMIGLSSIFWRESWKYGERALRYCNHDVGHAMAAIRFGANLFGWKVSWLNAASDDTVAVVLGLNQAHYARLEEEHPDLLCWIHSGQIEPCPVDITPEVVEAFAKMDFQGQPNQLSHKAIDWAIITETADQTRKPTTIALIPEKSRLHKTPAADCRFSAAELIRRRRSATAFASNGSLSQKRFLAILDKTLPHEARAPFDIGPLAPSANLILFVHRVRDLSPGLYAFMRCPSDLEPLRQLCRSDFEWSQTVSDFPLYLLEEGNFRQTATMLSCHQSIAGESVFSLGMLSRFRSNIESGAYRYRQLFWEAGMIGQVLYLEAEANDLRGTGIGCYFDDAVHDLLGLKDDAYQSLYHFTIGQPMDDNRLSTLPAYYHLNNRT